MAMLNNQIVRHFHRNSDYFLLERGEKSTGLINMPSPTRGGLDDCFREHQIHRPIPSVAEEGDSQFIAYD